MTKAPSSVLIVEDEPEIREALRDYINNQEFHTEEYDNAESALNAMNYREFDLVITDIKLPGMDGLELCKKIRQRFSLTNIIVITAFGNISSALLAIDYGADDYILKPFSLKSLKHSLEKVFERRRLEHENIKYQKKLEKLVRARRLEIEKAGEDIGTTFYKIVHVLGSAQECRETFLRGRTERVTILSLHLAQELGLNIKQQTEILLGAPISDIGKIAISESILNKATPLEDDEWELIRNHITEGAKIVGSLALFKDVLPIIQLHHERYDGSGYPGGLAGDEIPTTAAIVGIADTYDALTHDRPWRKAFSHKEAIQELSGSAGKLFDPELIEVFISVLHKNQLYNLIGTKPTETFYDLTFPILKKIE